MNNGGEAADQMVRQGIQITESAVKLTALGAKNLVAIALALVKNNTKLRGKTTLHSMLKEGKELKVFAIPAQDLPKFRTQAKHYGVLFAAIRQKNENQTVDILAKAEDVSKLNRIFEQIGYPIPQKVQPSLKNGATRLPQENVLRMRGLGVTQTKQTTSTDKRSVKETLRRICKLPHSMARDKTEPSVAEPSR